MGYWIVNGKQMTEAEYREHQRQELEAKERVQREQAALVKKLGETYAALTGLMQQHPAVLSVISRSTSMDEEIYGKLRQNLERADKAPRPLREKAVSTQQSAISQNKENGLPRINTDYTDRSDLPRIDADERGMEEEEEGSKVLTMRM